MKYLKRFNESIDRDVLKELATECLIDLVDLGFGISTEYIDDDTINLRIDTDNSGEKYTWDYLSDRFITLLQVLEDEYIINGVAIYYGGKLLFFNKISDIVNGIDIEEELEKKHGPALTCDAYPCFEIMVIEIIK